MTQNNLKNFFGTTNSYENDWEKIIAKKNYNLLLPLAAFLLSIGGISGFYFAYIHYNKCFSSIWPPCILSVLLEIIAIVFLLIYKFNADTSNAYNKQLILLRDLSIAIQLSDNLPDERETKTQNGAENSSSVVLTKVTTVHSKAKMQEQIIQTLLSHYSN